MLQGSASGPGVFNMFINDLRERGEQHRYKNFADGTVYFLQAIY